MTSLAISGFLDINILSKCFLILAKVSTRILIRMQLVKKSIVT